MSEPSTTAFGRRSQLHAEINPLLDNPDLCLVFPSEVSAGWWRRAAAERSGGAVRALRFAPWDQFKQRAFERRREQRPVNNTLRMLFAHDLLERNRSEELLVRLIAPEYRESSPAFAATLIELLPTLELLLDRVAARQGTVAELNDAATRSLLSDLRLIRNEYQAFLQRHSLFEPGYLKSAERVPDGRFVVLYPEALEDYAEFAEALETMDRVSVRPVPREPARVVLHRFENSVQEIQAALSQIETLLDDEVAQSEIAVTVCEDDRYLTELFSRAAAREIPLQARYGRPLTEHPGGRLMLRIEETAASNFAVDELGTLLLDQGLPIKDRQLAAAVTAFGVAHGCIGGDPPNAAGAWDRAFAADTSRGGSAVASYFRMLRRNITAIRGASDFDGLRAALNRFLSAFLDTDAWDEQGKRTLQWAQDLLAELRRIEHELGIGVSNPWRVFLRLLQTRRYVPLRRNEGIAVYLYRVSAAIAPRHHFVLGASHQATRVAFDRFAYLRPDQKERLGLDERDITADVLRLFSYSGAEVHLSFAGDTFSGRRLAPPLFLREGLIATPDDVTVRELRARDLYRRERAALHDARPEQPSGAPVRRYYRRQLDGLRAAASSGFGAGARELDRKPIADPGLRRRVQERLLHDGRLRLSSTHLRAYEECPFAFLIRHGLGIERVEYQPAAEAPIEIGSLFHRALERLCRAIAGSDPRIRSERLEVYREMARAAVREAVEVDLPGSTGIPPVAVPALQRRMEPALQRFVQGLAERFSGQAIFDIEAWRTAPASDPFDVAGEDDGGSAGGDDRSAGTAGDCERPLLAGKIDLMLQRPSDGGTVVLDYKLGGAPRKGELLALLEPQPTTVPAYQMAVYAVLVQHTQAPMSAALYYSIKETRFIHALGPPAGAGPGGGREKAWVSHERLPDLTAAACEQAARMAAQLRKGRYDEQAAHGSCAGCDLRAVCRRKFFIR